jgi:NAD(P)-dependent dehydrogenase (short-subunit alcohol dehydrogenase family)
MEDRTPLQLFKVMYKDQHTPLPLPSRSSVEGGTYIVTGANTGLGFECAQHLVNLGAARVVLGVRSIEKGKAAQMAIEKTTGRRGVCEVWQIDLASFDSVEAFSARIATLDRVDAIVNNAGIEVDGWRTVENGLEASLAVNVLSTLLLCLKALPILSKVAKRHGIHPRMEIVSSAVVHMVNDKSVDSVTGNIFDAWSQESAMSGLRLVQL